MNFRKALLLMSAAVWCLSFTACGDETAEETTTAEPTAQVQTSVTTAYTPQELHTQKTYYYAALQGALIVEQDGTRNFKYQKKCDVCGYLDNTRVNVSKGVGTLDTSFRCHECGNHQKVKIRTTN